MSPLNLIMSLIMFLTASMYVYESIEMEVWSIKVDQKQSSTYILCALQCCDSSLSLLNSAMPLQSYKSC